MQYTNVKPNAKKIIISIIIIFTLLYLFLYSENAYASSNITDTDTSINTITSINTDTTSINTSATTSLTYSANVIDYIEYEYDENGNYVGYLAIYKMIYFNSYYYCTGETYIRTYTVPWTDMSTGIVHYHNIYVYQKNYVIT